MMIRNRDVMTASDAEMKRCWGSVGGRCCHQDMSSRQRRGWGEEGRHKRSSGKGRMEARTISSGERENWVARGRESNQR